jgi:hypothetical protein
MMAPWKKGRAAGWDGNGRKKAQNAQKKKFRFCPAVLLSCPALQYVRFAPFREDFTADFTDDTDWERREEIWKAESGNSLSVKSVKSVVKFLWLRLCHARPFAPFRGYPGSF